MVYVGVESARRSSIIDWVCRLWERASPVSVERWIIKWLEAVVRNEL